MGAVVPGDSVCGRILRDLLQSAGSVLGLEWGDGGVTWAWSGVLGASHSPGVGHWECLMGLESGAGSVIWAWSGALGASHGPGVGCGVRF